MKQTSTYRFINRRKGGAEFSRVYIKVQNKIQHTYVRSEVYNYVIFEVDLTPEEKDAFLRNTDELNIDKPVVFYDRFIKERTDKMTHGINVNTIQDEMIQLRKTPIEHDVVTDQWFQTPVVPRRFVIHGGLRLV